MSTVVLADTGPLVALLDARDAWHGWACDRFAELADPVWTCEAVIAEATYLIGRVGARHAVLGLMERGVVQVRFSLEEEQAAVSALIQRYADVPMDLADACLVRMSEQHDDSTVLTLDSDFRIYRRHGRKAIPLICPR